MSNQETLYKGITRVIWGYFFVYFDFKLGTLSVTPAFVGIWMFLSAIDLLKEERRNMELLRTFAYVLLFWNFARWAAAWGGLSVQGYLPIVGLLVSIINMYFHFQLMTDLAALANKYASSESMIEPTLLRWRSIQTILLTCVVLISYTDNWNYKYKETIQILMGIAYVLAGIFLMLELFTLRKVFHSEECQM